MTAKDLINNEIAQNLFKKINVHVHFFLQMLCAILLIYAKMARSEILSTTFASRQPGFKSTLDLKCIFLRNVFRLSVARLSCE